VPVWLIWLLPVLLAPLVAIAWTAFASRSRGPVEAMDTVQAHERFRQAMAAPVPVPRTRRRPPSARPASHRAP